MTAFVLNPTLAIAFVTLTRDAHSWRATVGLVACHMAALSSATTWRAVNHTNATDDFARDSSFDIIQIKSIGWYAPDSSAVVPWQLVTCCG